MVCGQNLRMESKPEDNEYVAQDPTEIMEILLGVKGVHLIGVESKHSSFRAVIETLDDEVTCSNCATTAEPAGRPLREIVDQQAFGRTVIFQWHVRGWRCANPNCPTDKWDEEMPVVGSAQWAQRRKQ